MSDLPETNVGDTPLNPAPSVSRNSPSHATRVSKEMEGATVDGMPQMPEGTIDPSDPMHPNHPDHEKFYPAIDPRIVPGGELHPTRPEDPNHPDHEPSDEVKQHPQWMHPMVAPAGITVNPDAEELANVNTEADPHVTSGYKDKAGPDEVEDEHHNIMPAGEKLKQTEEKKKMSDDKKKQAEKSMEAQDKLGQSEAKLMETEDKSVKK